MFVATAFVSWESSLLSSTTYLTKILSEMTPAKGACFVHVAGKAFATQLQCQTLTVLHLKCAFFIIRIYDEIAQTYLTVLT